MPFPGSTERPVKAVSPACRGRSGAESLDGAEASRRISDVMAASVVVTAGEGLRRQRDAEPSGDPGQVDLAPAVTKQERNRDGLRKLRRREAIGCADDLREEIVWLEFVEEHRDERTRPREMPRACGHQPHRTRTELAPPALGIGVLFRSGSVIELPSDVDQQLAGFAHGCTSSKRPGAGARQVGAGLGPRPRGVGMFAGRAGMCPHSDDQGQWTVVRRRLAARSSVKRPSCQGVR